MIICGDELISDGMPTDNFRTWPNPGSKRGMGVKQQKPSNSGELEFNELTPEVWRLISFSFLSFSCIFVFEIAERLSIDAAKIIVLAMMFQGLYLAQLIPKKTWIFDPGRWDWGNLFLRDLKWAPNHRWVKPCSLSMVHFGSTAWDWQAEKTEWSWIWFAYIYIDPLDPFKEH